jgi:hypothetical protein
MPTYASLYPLRTTPSPAVPIVPARALDRVETEQRSIVSLNPFLHLSQRELESKK